jgi:pimeloyl-ACP methyl ester carboxylesterase
LFVHGILGNSTSLVTCLPRLQQALEAQALTRYDLALTIDYENLNTPIEQTARLLKERLAQAGLTPGHTKTLHIVAHSMGGLVSRFMLEQVVDARGIAQKLVMAGTPNAGSPWPSIVDYANTALALGLNSLSAMAWATGPIAWLLRVLGTATGIAKTGIVSDDQMKANPLSEFLQTLETSTDPGVPYLTIAGTNAIRAGADQALLQRLVNKLKVNLPGAVFLGQTNDLAVSTKSVQHLPSWSTAVQAAVGSRDQLVSCDHFTYFNTDPGIQALAKALK